jgi:hypothetical protein
MTRHFKSILALILGFIVFVNAQDFRKINGYVRNKQGVPLCSAVVVITNIGPYIYTLSDETGYYTFGDGGDTIIVGISHSMYTPLSSNIQVRNNTIFFNLFKHQFVRIGLYDLQGRLVSTAVNKSLSFGDHSFPLADRALAKKLYIVRAQIGTQTSSFKYIPSITSGFRFSRPSYGHQPVAKRTSTSNFILRTSSPGYRTKVQIDSSFVYPFDFALDTLISDVGSHAIVDGTVDRFTIWGDAVYYLGVVGSDTIPMVKIIQAKSHRVVDVAVIFNPQFVDLTYGKNVIGWNKHSFNQLVGSDHVQITIRDTDSTDRFQGKIDLLTATNLVPSGYASLGMKGGDGEVTIGSTDDVYAHGTSFDDNINWYGYHLFQDSPETDSIYTPNPNYPMWEYYAVYHVCINDRVLGGKPYGYVFMSSVHASPSKIGPDTIYIIDIVNTIIIDPFIYIKTFTLPNISK